MVKPGFRGYQTRGGGYAELFPTVDEFLGTTYQVSGGFWPFGTDMALPVHGVPLGRKRGTGAGVCCDPVSWFKAGIVAQPSMFVMGLPSVGKSTLVRRLILGGAAMGLNTIVPGDLKPDHADLITQLGGQVNRLGTGLGSINPLDPGEVHSILPRLTGAGRTELLEDYQQRRSAALQVILAIARGKNDPLTDVEKNVLAGGLEDLFQATKNNKKPPVLADLRDLIKEGTPLTRTAANFENPDDDETYHKVTSHLVGSLHGLANPHGMFRNLFSEQTSSPIDMSRPVDYDISGLEGSADTVLAAVLTAVWSSTFAAKNAADLLADAGLEPRRLHLIILDEMHRAMRSSPLMVEQFDLLTRLNRQWGVGQIMITHTFADLLSLDSDEQNKKAAGFFARSAIKLLGALPPAEIRQYLRPMGGLSVSQREEDLLADWATPTGYGANASVKGQGKFLIKVGNLPGIDIDVQLSDLELTGFNDTSRKWHE